MGVVQAGATGTTRVLKFNDPPGVETAIGFNLNSNTPPPIGASVAVTVRLQNGAPQFGKPSGAIVGRVVEQCTVLASGSTPDALDGLCTGIAHVPDGYFTFSGNGIFATASAQHYDITGGVGPYANARGQATNVNLKNGRGLVTINLSS